MLPFCFRAGLVRVRSPQVRDGLPRDGIQGMCGGGDQVPREDRRSGRAEPVAPQADVASAVLRCAEGAGLEAGDDHPLGVRRFPAVPSEPAATLAGGQPRRHRPSTPGAAAASPEHARAGAFRYFDFVCADDGRRHGFFSENSAYHVCLDAVDDDDVVGLALQPAPVPSEHLQHPHNEPSSEL